MLVHSFSAMVSGFAFLSAGGRGAGRCYCWRRRRPGLRRLCPAFCRFASPSPSSLSFGFIFLCLFAEGLGGGDWFGYVDGFFFSLSFFLSICLFISLLFSFFPPSPSPSTPPPFFFLFVSPFFLFFFSLPFAFYFCSADLWSRHPVPVAPHLPAGFSSFPRRPSEGSVSLLPIPSSSSSPPSERGPEETPGPLLIPESLRKVAGRGSGAPAARWQFARLPRVIPGMWRRRPPAEVRRGRGSALGYGFGLWFLRAPCKGSIGARCRGTAGRESTERRRSVL